MKKIKQIHLSQFSEDNAPLIVKCEPIATPGFPIHSHDYFEIELITEGIGIQNINGKKYEIKPGMFYLLSPSDTHKYYTKNEIIVWNISFSHSYLPENFDHLIAQYENNLVFYLEEKEMDFVRQIFINALNEHSNDLPFADNILYDSLHIFLTLIMRKGNFSADNIENITQESPVASAITYVKLHFTENPTLKTVAHFLHINPSYLSTAFKKTTKLSYTDYLLSLKISHAKKLLKHTSDAITSIAFNSGFDSICNFNRSFKKMTNRSPSQYRKNYLLTHPTAFIDE